MIHDPMQPLKEYLPALVKHGACICWPANVLTVPIPIIGVLWFDERCFVWATIQTPFGSQRPLFGMVSYASQDRLPAGGSAFLDVNGKKLCAVIPNEAFGFPPYTVEKLRKKSEDHHQRWETDTEYRDQWQQWWADGIGHCVQDQTSD